MKTKRGKEITTHDIAGDEKSKFELCPKWHEFFDLESDLRDILYTDMNTKEEENTIREALKLITTKRHEFEKKVGH